MTPFLVIFFAWVLLFLTIGLFQTWMDSHGNMIEWWYRRINTDPSAGVWYYGTVAGARRRRRHRSN